MSEFGKRLKQARKRLGLTALEMSTKIGIEKNSYYKYEDGGRFPKADILISLVKKLNINVNFLLTGKGNMFLEKSESTEKPEFNDLFPDVPFDKDILELISLLEVPIIRHSMLIEFYKQRKEYRSFIKEYFENKQKDNYQSE